jgi:hypothetical protein
MEAWRVLLNGFGSVVIFIGYLSTIQSHVRALQYGERSVFDMAAIAIFTVLLVVVLLCVWL